MLLFLFFFALWLLLNGRVTGDVIGFGLVIAAGVTVFAVKICGWSEERTLRIVKLSGQLCAYFVCLFAEIIKANLAVMKVILAPKTQGVSPRVFHFHSGLKRPFANTILANSITITPGTYTIGVDGDMLTIHGLNADFTDGAPDSALNRRLMRLEETLQNETRGERRK